MRAVRVRGSRVPIRLFALAAACAPLLVPFAQSRASTQANWLNAVSGNWTDPANWSTNPNYPNNGTPTGTTYDAVLDAAGSAYTVTLDNDIITLNSLDLTSADATLSLVGSAAIAFDGVSSIDGSGQVIFNGNGSTSLTSIGGSGAGLTIGSNMTIRTGTAGGTIGSAGASLINNGTLSFQTASTGSTITGANWVNKGTINLSAGTLNLNGTFASASLGNFSHTGGTLVIRGTMDNTGEVFDLAHTGAFSLSGGTIKGGTIQSSNGTQSRYSTGVLDGVTIDYPMLVSSLSSFPVTIQDGLTINNRAITAEMGDWHFSGTQTLGGTGTITFTGYRYSDEEMTISGDDLSIGQGITIQTGPAESVASGYFNIEGGHWTNYGTIIEQTPELPMQFTGDHWSNQGTIRLSAGALFLGGTFKPEALGNFIRTGGRVFLVGTVDNVNDTLALNAGTGSWSVDEGRINGGTVTSSDGAMLINVNQASLDWVKLDAPILNKPQSWLIVGGDLTLDDSTITLEGSGSFPYFSNTYLQFSSTASQTLGGTGGIVFDAGIDDHYSGVTGSNTPHTVTFGPSVTFRTGTGSGAFGGDFINQGMISAETTGQTIAVTDHTFTNDGTMQAINGGTVKIFSGATLANFSSNTLTGGNWIVGAGSALDFSGRTFTTNAAHILLDGAGSTFAAVAPLASNTGTFEIDHGRDFTTVGSLDNSGVLRIGHGSTLTINGTLTNSGRINGKGRIIGNITSSGTIAPGDSPGLLTIAGNLTESPDATIEIEVGGTTPGVDYDVLDISGLTTLSGTLQITLVNGFVPAPDQTFDFFDLASTTGQFSNVILPDLPPGVTWDIDALKNGGPTGVPEPSAIFLLFALPALTRRRRMPDAM